MSDVTDLRSVDVTGSVVRADPAWLAAVIVCPTCLTHGVLDQIHTDGDLRFHQCRACGRVYPVDEFGVVDFQPPDRLLELPEGPLEMWALAQIRSLDDYRARDPGSVASSDRAAARAFGRFIRLDGARVLDVGGGTDYIPAYLQGHAMRQYVGLDPLPAERAIPFTKVRAWAEFLPFADATFDAMLCGTSLDHVLGLEAAVRELVRVLRPGGRLYLWTALFADAKWFTNLLPGSWFDRPDDRGRRGIDEFREDTERLRARIGNASELEERFASLLVDKWHFRHLPVAFVKDLVEAGLSPRKLEVWEHNFHEGSVFLNAFLELENRGAIDDTARDVDRQLGIWATLAGLTERVAAERQETAMVRDAVAGVRLHTELAREDIRNLASALTASAAADVTPPEDPSVRMREDISSAVRSEVDAVGTRLDEIRAAQTAHLTAIERLIEMEAGISDAVARLAAAQDQAMREQERLAADMARLAEEQTHAATEQARVAHDQERLAADMARLAEEQTRVATEQARLAQEQERLAIEEARVAPLIASLGEQVQQLWRAAGLARFLGWLRGSSGKP